MSTGGGAGTTGGNPAGAGGLAGSAGAAGSDPGELDCSGSFGVGELLISVDPPMDLGGPSIPANELELYYSLDTGNGVASFVVARRTSSDGAFTAAAPVPGIGDACTTPFGTMDITDDGLRIYYACWSD